MPVCSSCLTESEPADGQCPQCGGAMISTVPEESTRRGAVPEAPGSQRPTIAPKAGAAAALAARNGPEARAGRTGSSGQPMGAVAVAQRPAPAPPPARSPSGGARLLLHGSDGQVVEFAIGDQAVLGRSTSASVRLADRVVSRKHSQIDKQAGDYLLKDL